MNPGSAGELVLAVNGGSTNLKFGLYTLDGGREPEALVRGALERENGAIDLKARRPDGAAEPPMRWNGDDHPSLIAALLDWTQERLGSMPLAAVGHRVVHGGTRFTTATAVSDDLPDTLHALNELAPFAPLHQPENIAGIRAVAMRHPQLLQVACFDTAFHATQARLARLYALPRQCYEAGIRRYGFHGLSYQYVAQALARLRGAALAEATVIAHLGGGASLCGLAGGESRASTMGLTALDGLPMGTRCGTLDPGVVLYLTGARGMKPAELEHMLYRESGLKGVSGLSGDMRTLLASEEPAAQEAVALFVARSAREIAAIATEIGGLQTLVFTGGIGEHQPAIRARIVQALRWLGLALDQAANADAAAHGARRIDAAGSSAQIWVVPTDEESVIAAETARLLRARRGREPQGGFAG
jgi:acetate kinase